MKISIVIITLNKLGHLRGVLATLAALAFPRTDFEVLVVDDGSSDGTGEFLAGFSPPYSFRWLRQANAGRAAARNACARMARGELLVILDDDCLMEPSSLDHLWRAHQEQPERMLLSTVRHVGVDHVGRVLERIATEGPVPVEDLDALAPVDEEYALAGLVREMLAYGIDRFAVPWLAAPGTSVSIAAETFRRLGGYDQSFVSYGMEDFDFAFRFADTGAGFRWVPPSFLYHLDHGHQRAVLFKESTVSTRTFYEKFRHKMALVHFIKFLCGVITFRELNNRVAAAEGLAPIESFDVRFSPYGMVRYRDRQLTDDSHRKALPLAYSPAQEARLRFLLTKIQRDIEEDLAIPRELAICAGQGGKRVLVIAPHMDDEVIGCGGLVHRFSQAGSKVTALFLTDGAARNLPLAECDQVRRDRRLESERAADILGIDRCIYFDIPERRLAEATRDPEPIARVLAEVQPDVVLVPGRREYHPDHRAAFDWLSQGLALSSSRPEVFCYEIWGSCQPDHLLPLDDATWERKVTALSMYQTQLRSLDYQRLMSYLSTARIRGTAAEIGRAEVYRRVEATEQVA